MVTRILDAEKGLDEAVSLLKAGELVAFPTETVYGLGADGFNGAAGKKIFEAKGRPQDNPLIVHIASVEQAAEVARDIPEEFYILAREFMPGPLTVVLPKSDAVPGVVTAGGDTVAVRMPSHPVARRLIAASMPLAAPSANRSKHISPTTARHVLDDLDGRVPLILDGGECGVGIESTVLDLTSAVPTVLRPGAVTEEMIAELLGKVGSLSPGAVIGRAKSPGMKYTHYAPSVPAVVAMSEEAALARYDEIAAAGGRPVLLMTEPHRAAAGGRAFISLGEDAVDYMRLFYAAMREAESARDYIIIEGLTGGGEARSVMNRVLKSAGGNVIG